jgi:hypothetical protein
MANRYEEDLRLTGLSGTQDLKQRPATPDTSSTRPLTEQDPFYPAFWHNVIEKSSNVPPGENPAWWPIRVLNELDELVTYRDISILSPRKAELADKLGPIQDSLRKIKTAFSIIAHPHCTPYQRAVSELVAHDQRALQYEGTPRTQFELNDTELSIVRKLCETPRYTLAERDENGRRYDSPVKVLHSPIPFNPQRRIFRYSEVPPARV